MRGRPYDSDRNLKCLWPAFDPLERDGVGHYLTLLNLYGDASASIRAVPKCGVGCRSVEGQIIYMLGDIGWRPNLVGLVASMLIEPSDAVVEALWVRIEDGSWVSPQLAVAVAELGDGFAERAEEVPERLAADSSSWSPKSAAALNALVGGSEDNEVKELVDKDDQNAAGIALQWRDGFRNLTMAA